VATMTPIVPWWDFLEPKEDRAYSLFNWSKSIHHGYDGAYRGHNGSLKPVRKL
jgi:hypothetical protein